MPATALFAILLVLFALPRVRGWLLGGSGSGGGLELTESSYRAPFIALEALKRWRIAVPLAVITLLYALLWTRLAWPTAAAATPTDADAASTGFVGLRWVIAGIALTFAWSFATYDRNRFLGRSHNADRLLLIALCAGVFWHPLFIAPLIVHSVLIARQFEHPRCMEYSFTHIRAPLDLLIIAALALPTVALTGAPAAVTPLLLLSSLAAAYVYPALQKTRVGHGPLWWLAFNRCDRLFISSHINGWLTSLRTTRLIAAARTMALAGVLLNLATLAVEFGSGLLLLDRTLCAALLLANVGLHAVIFALSGINFWKWAIADALLAWFVLTLPEPAAAALFNPAMLAASLAMILTAPLHFAPMRLGWADTRLNQLFRFEAVGHDGTECEIPRTHFAPYDMAFAQNRFYFLSPVAPLVMTYGTTAGIGQKGARLIDEIERTGGDPGRIDALRPAYGRAHNLDHAAREFDRFLRIVLGGTPKRPRWRRLLAAPKHIYCSTQPGAVPYKGQEPIASVRVRYLETWYDDRTIHIVRDEIIREIEISAPVVVIPRTPPVQVVIDAAPSAVAA